MRTGWIVVLNGAPRSGKSTLAREIQSSFEGAWIHLGVDISIERMLPEALRPGPGLRPGGERPDLEPMLLPMALALYDSAAAHARQGLNVVMDLGHHDDYSSPLNLLPQCARQVVGLPAALIGVRCSLEEILRRRALGAHGRTYLQGSDEDPVPAPVLRWQEAVHRHGIYDLEVDTSLSSPGECADRIRQLLISGLPSPSAFEVLRLR